MGTRDSVIADSPAIEDEDSERAPVASSGGSGDEIGAATLDLFESQGAYSAFVWERLRFGELRGKVLEVGCGIGTFSRRILSSSGVTRLDSVDIDRAYVDRLATELDDERFHAHCSPAEDFGPPAPPYDLAVSSNVFEHIEDDLAAMRMVAAALAPGGEFWILVPAHPALFCALDEGLSHFRRYTRESLSALARDAGLGVETVAYFNPLAALGWWFTGKILRRRMLPRGQVSIYERFGIAISRWLDRLNPLPFGVSVIARLRKD